MYYKLIRLNYRKEEFAFTDITDEDLRSRYQHLQVTVNTIEHCARYHQYIKQSVIVRFLARICSLGSACDTFFIDLTGMTCTFIPHVSLKSFNLIDFVNYVDDDKKDMYVLQCAQGLYSDYVLNLK